MFRLLLVILLLLCLAACTLNTVAPSAPPSSATTLKTLVDDFAGFAVDYPANWYISGAPAPDAVIYSFTIISFDTSGLPGRDEGVPSNETKIDVNVHREATGFDDLRKSSIEGATKLIQETWTVSSTIQAIWLHMTIPPVGEWDGGDREVLFAVVGNRAVYMTCFGNTAPCKAIMRSLRPAP